MGFIILPLNLAMLLVVTSVAAMPQSSDDMHVKSVARKHPVQRHLGTRSQYCTHLDSEYSSSTNENYMVCIIRPQTGQVNAGNIFGLVDFQSGEGWGGYKFLQTTTTNGASCICSNVIAVPYDENQVANITVLTTGCTDCNWFLTRVIIKIPSDSECYLCNHDSEFADVQIVPDVSKKLTCALNTNDKYCR